MRMIRWLSGTRLKPDATPEAAVTQDPLAALSKQDQQIYQVTRVNPLYKEEVNPTVEPPSPKGGQDSPRKSISSGYESRGNSSSDSGSCAECEAKPKREKRGKQERKKRDKTNVLIGNVLAANYSSIKRRQRKFSSNGSLNGTTHLSPIPEGQVDHSIPAPIWPRCTSCQSPLVRVHSGTTDPHNFIHKYNEHFPTSSNFRIQFLKEVAEDHPRYEYQHNWEECFKIQFEKHRIQPPNESDLPQGILQDLATFLSQAMKDKNSLTADEVLLLVSESIKRCLPVARQLSPREELYSSSSSSGCKDIYAASSSASSFDSVAERLKIFRRQKEEEIYHGDVEKSSEGEGADKVYVHHHRDLSSSSLDSSLSFSPSSSSSKALNDEIYSVPTTSSAIASAKRVNECGSSAYDKLISAKRKVSDAVEEQPTAVVVPCGTKDRAILKKVEHPYYVSVGRPDFTLDIPQAERMMNKIALAKRQRCWCRMATSFLALVFFLLSVIIVSLVITRGRKTFGAI